MGEIAHVDLGRLRAVADSFWGTAADVAGMPWPVLDTDALPGSSVEATNTAELITDLVDGLTADLNGWATAARASAEAFQHADAVNGERFGSR
ncbi:hypothetical protein [Mycolicibacterium iranicum]|uniref:ESX-1 secretion-associated protein n=1 Tax=Mycolicibacterium iranicum TaxID=912594 RepID=A0A1X1WWV8_MYCIR|nr:hypothetical protein [Mycolicibacterium iranicum]MCZ0728178.1 hypothetical protein [Mycolicibacterium iranicum]ORV90978.1 hypothetical protein AWC12_05360 [Mycolicibacterium iranicum]